METPSHTAAKLSRRTRRINARMKLHGEVAFRRDAQDATQCLWPFLDPMSIPLVQLDAVEQTRRKSRQFLVLVIERARQPIEDLCPRTRQPTHLPRFAHHAVNRRANGLRRRRGDDERRHAAPVQHAQDTTRRIVMKPRRLPREPPKMNVHIDHCALVLSANDLRQHLPLLLVHDFVVDRRDFAEMLRRTEHVARLVEVAAETGRAIVTALAFGAALEVGVRDRPDAVGRLRSLPHLPQTLSVAVPERNAREAGTRIVVACRTQAH